MLGCSASRLGPINPGNMVTYVLSIAPTPPTNMRSRLRFIRNPQDFQATAIRQPGRWKGAIEREA
eukprot:scaffold102359_cov18-Prasinocladus_malaysianus.AAC.2